MRKYIGGVVVRNLHCRGSMNTEPGADRGPRAGSPRGVMDATGLRNIEFNVLIRWRSQNHESEVVFSAGSTRSLPLPVLYSFDPQCG